MQTFLKVIGYILLILFVLRIIDIVDSVWLDIKNLSDVLTHFLWAAGILASGIYLAAGRPRLVTLASGIYLARPRLVEKTDFKSSFMGILSLLVGTIGIFIFPFVLGIVAVALAILQLRRRNTKIAVAGLSLGVIDLILAAIWYPIGGCP